MVFQCEYVRLRSVIKKKMKNEARGSEQTKLNNLQIYKNMGYILAVIKKVNEHFILGMISKVPLFFYDDNDAFFMTHFIKPTGVGGN